MRSVRIGKANMQNNPPNEKEDLTSNIKLKAYTAPKLIALSDFDINANPGPGPDGGVVQNSSAS